EARRERPSGARRRLKDALVPIAQVIELSSDRRDHPRWSDRRLLRPLRFDLTLAQADRTASPELLQIERIAAAVAVDGLAQPRIEARIEEGDGLVRAQVADLQPAARARARRVLERSDKLPRGAAIGEGEKQSAPEAAKEVDQDLH